MLAVLYCLYSLSSCWLSVQDGGPRPSVNLGGTRLRPAILRARYRFLSGQRACDVQRAFQRTPVRSKSAPKGHTLTIRLQQIAAALGWSDGFADACKKGLEASHLCHRPLCFNPDHIVLESHRENVLRTTCKPARQVTGADDRLKVHCPHGTGRYACVYPKLHLRICETSNVAARSCFTPSGARV